MRSLALIALALAGCTDNEASTRALEGLGFSEIQLTGYKIIGCAQDDTYSTGFTARNPAGKLVSGVVCCADFSGCTVRF